jgi:hypothetical protein
LDDRATVILNLARLEHLSNQAVELVALLLRAVRIHIGQDLLDALVLDLSVALGTIVLLLVQDFHSLLLVDTSREIPVLDHQGLLRLLQLIDGLVDLCDVLLHEGILFGCILSDFLNSLLIIFNQLDPEKVIVLQVVEVIQ